LPRTVPLAPRKNKAPKFLNDKTGNKNEKTDYHCMTDCPRTSKEAAVEMLAKHRAALAERP
jgi:transcription initiation factor IIE alpha subunit